ncbi:cytochrome c oxidase assembly protein [Amycolatopsis thermoflava]|uniref:cytochrome c oxidase assembly protein n=1 Tax=Amycolatopsis thermoflava TaxID=84480 RepID=UPI00382A4F1A
MAEAGLPLFTWTTALTQWSWHTLPIALIVVFGAWYVRRVRRLRRNGGEWPISRLAWFVGALGSYASVTLTSIGTYGPVLFSARAAQVVTLLMITPQFLAHALPGRLARDTATPRNRVRASRILHSATVRVITHPFVGVVVLLGMPIALYGSGWYEASLRAHWLDEFTQVALLVAGAHYFWTRLQRDPVPKVYPQVVSVALTFAEVALDVIVPLAILMSGKLIAYDYYRELGNYAGVSIQADQFTGAGILWAVGDLALVPFLCLSMRQMLRRDRALAEIVDRELDERQRGDGLEPASATTRPWWEDDPDLAARFRARPSGREG